MAVASTTEDDLYQNTPYITELLRQAKTAEIESFMDQEADPCTDFYTFSCGNYARINPASVLGVPSTELFKTLQKGLERKILKTLHMAYDTQDTPEDKQVKHFFESCLRIKELSSTYTTKMKELIAEFGTMPILEGSSWKEEDFDWLETSANIAHKYGISSFINVKVNKDFGNNQRNRIYIETQRFPLNTRSMYVDNATAIYRQNYRTNIQHNLQRSLGVEMKLAIQTARELLDFEVDLAQGLPTPGQGPNDFPELLTVAEMQKKYSPTLDIDQFIFISLGERVFDRIYELDKRYQENLFKVLKRTPKRTIANYIFFRLIWEFVEAPNEKPGKQEKVCLNLTKKFFFKNLDNMIYRRYKTDKSSKEREHVAPTKGNLY